MRYPSPRWLPGGHAQTLYPLLIKPEAPAFRRERWDTPDDDFIDLDWKDAAKTDDRTPLLVLFHGLEGSSDSHYARSLVRAAFAAGWNSVVVHFRGCSGEPNRLPRAPTTPATARRSTGSCGGCASAIRIANFTPSAFRSAATPCSNGSANKATPPPP